MLVPPANFGIAEDGIYRCSKIETINLSFLETLNLKKIIFIGGQEPSKFFKEFFNRSSINWNIIKISEFHTTTTATTTTTTKPTDNNNNNNQSSSQIPPPPSSSSSITTSASTSTSTSSSSSNGNSINDNNVNNNNDTSTIISNTKKNTIRNSKIDYINKPYHLNDNDDLMLIKSKCLKKTFQLLLNSNNFNILLVDKTALIISILRKIQKWHISSIINEYRLFSGKNRSYFAETFLEFINIIIKQDYDTIESDSNNPDNNVETDHTHHSISITVPKLDLTTSPQHNQLLTTNNNLSSKQMQRNLSSLSEINEDDLCNDIVIPSRLLNIVNDAELEAINEREIIQQQEQDENNQSSSSSSVPSFQRSPSILKSLSISAASNSTSIENTNTSSSSSITKNNNTNNHTYTLSFKKKEYNDFVYYKPSHNNNNINSSTNDNNDNNSIILKIPKESSLPNWFKFQRDLWEKENAPDKYNFYKEHIFI
ncbi:Oca4p NDAI_0I00290 [Naumovozyma dairenensis CBS 421]|uniref:Protein OCA4 n=1 Tax=Naumovozyma dairenensis (strain ATCC 10597 / BCRC 20456 / CBS 421 / NBRC 0211 / NRRL Y-12639) TaxID=1071378 RepID=G0WFN7_NAUDC|nr:hypothetical protein NDAI_0I00290 [Naumovozyma dairenensis CBS 421]CCD26598.1 hypothetical protein NDAI_0I00290 [Naumovozyma dairenensis CBS 421]